MPEDAARAGEPYARSQQSQDDSATKIRAVGRPAPALHEVVVTGVGVILPNCDNREQFWEQLRDGQSQLTLESDPVEQMAYAVGRVHDFDARKYLVGIPESLYANWHREQRFYVASLLLACRDAELDVARLASDRVGLYDGTSRGSFAFWYEQIKSKIEHPNQRFTTRELNLGMPGQAVGLAAATLGIKGPTYTFNGTCASGAIAVGHAYRELQSGRIDLALGTGHDAALVRPLFQMYRDANLMSRESSTAAQAIRPYVGHSANAFGEGAVTLMLETREHAEARAAPILATIAGYRYGNGGDHPTDVDFTGGRPAALITDALDEGELT
ncbi:MAG TPA: beta-ketoacyl synthase N-terminal-like domain-containing protein, partial [Polyangiaceae bacterium]